MGVFDDSDDDTDDGKAPAGRPGPGLLDLNGESSPTAAGQQRDDDDADVTADVDPLDAYMCGVQSEAERDAEDTKRHAACAAADDAGSASEDATKKRAASTHLGITKQLKRIQGECQRNRESPLF